MNNNVVLDICLAVQKGQTDEAKASFAEVIASAENQVVISAMNDALIMACRKRQNDLFIEWLLLGQQRLTDIITAGENVVACGNLLQSLVFTACDRRLVEAFPHLQFLLHKWLCINQSNSGQLNLFWHEWMNLIARMARRGWRRETAWLMKILGCWLWHQQDVKEWQYIMQQLSLHFTVHAKWDGFNKACAAFVELQYFYLIIVSRAGNVKRLPDERRGYLLLALRNIRDLIANVSRSIMQEDMDVFRQWYQFLWQLAGDNERRKRRLRLLLQLAISYWQNTRPKTSGKQAQFLQDLLQPNMITANYRNLLADIC